MSRLAPESLTPRSDAPPVPLTLSVPRRFPSHRSSSPSPTPLPSQAAGGARGRSERPAQHSGVGVAAAAGARGGLVHAAASLPHARTLLGLGGHTEGGGQRGWVGHAAKPGGKRVGCRRRGAEAGNGSHRRSGALAAASGHEAAGPDSLPHAAPRSCPASRRSPTCPRTRCGMTTTRWTAGTAGGRTTAPPPCGAPSRRRRRERGRASRPSSSSRTTTRTTGSQRTGTRAAKATTNE